MKFGFPTFLALVVGLLAVVEAHADVNRSCTNPPPGLVSWWPMDGSTDDIAAGNNPAAQNALRFVDATVDDGVSFGSGGFIDIPHAENLANQTFTIDVWVRSDGPGPTNDQFGSVIVNKAVTGATTSVLLSWRGSDNRFVFAIGNITSERILSANAFPAGKFYHVAATYDGAVFKLYVDGVLEGQYARTKAVDYNPSIEWAIGANPWNFRPPNNVYPRTWNGVLDEVEIFSRALTASEIQAIANAGSSDRCKVTKIEFDTIPGGDPRGAE